MGPGNSVTHHPLRQPSWRGALPPLPIHLFDSLNPHGSDRCSIGYHELFCNGIRQGVSGAKLQPGYTNFEKRTYYIVYDLSHCLKAGNNSLGILLGNGWFSKGSENHSSPYATTLPGSRPVPPQMLLRARATVNNNSAVFISSSTNGKWTAANGPIVTDSLYNGGVYDARRELVDKDGRHFSHPLYDTQGADWAPAARVDWIPETAQLVPQTMPPIRMIRKLSAKSIHSPSPGIWVIDFAQNSAAIIRFRVPRMALGSNITIIHGEVLLNGNMSLQGKSPLFSANESGRVYTDNLRTAQATDVYLLYSTQLDFVSPGPFVQWLFWSVASSSGAQKHWCLETGTSAMEQNHLESPGNQHLPNMDLGTSRSITGQVEVHH